MPDNEDNLEGQLARLGQAYRRGLPKVHPVAEKHLAQVRKAIEAKRQEEGKRDKQQKDEERRRQAAEKRRLEEQKEEEQRQSKRRGQSH